MSTAGTPRSFSLVAHVRRLSKAGSELYIRIGNSDISRLGLSHGQAIEIDLGRVHIAGIVKTSGGSPWLAPASGSSNAAITAVLREARFEHGMDVSATAHSAQGGPGSNRDGGGYNVLGAGTMIGRTSGSGAGMADRTAVKRRAVVTTWSTITLETAKYAVKIYNEGLYGCLKNPDLDKQAREMFADGLGSTSAKIGRHVEFIGRDYGGAAGFKAAYALAPDITRDIVANREQYEKAALSASPLLAQIPSRDTIEILYRPFVKPLHGKSNWQVWATKFWHFLNADAFPIEDSRVDKFFLLTDLNSVDKYLKFLNRFREFALSHQEWLPHLRQIDAGADGDVPCSDNKLWDKMFYGLGDLKA